MLYQDYVELSLKLVEIIEEMAVKYPHVKFCKSVATKSIDNYDDCDVPGILLYQNAELKRHFIPALKYVGGSKMSYKIVEFLFS